MAGFRSQRQHHEGPSAWELPSSVFEHVGWHPNDAIVWTNLLSPVAGPAAKSDQLKDNRGLFMTTGGHMLAELDYVLDWVRDVLVLHQTDGWKKGKHPKFVKDVLTDFYKNSDRHIASVTAESSRDSIRLRHSGFSESLSQTGMPEFGREADHIKYQDVIPLIGKLVIPTKDLEFVVPKGYDEKQTVFTKMFVQRALAKDSGPPIIGEWTTCCVAEENSDKLTSGSAPASKNLLLHNEINPARLMTWWRLNPTTGWTYTVAFDLEAGSGRVFSIRYAKVTLEMQIGLDPWLDDWLLGFLYKQIARSKAMNSVPG